MVSPRISVIIPTYNSERFLKPAIDSVLNQSYEDFELIIVNEYGNIDRTDDVLKEYDDDRIIIHNNQGRLGLVPSLNIGLNKAKGEFIARMDADDICVPHRFERQVGYLDNHPGIGIVGAGIRQIDENGVPHSVIYNPENSKLVRWSMMFNDVVAQPTVMARRSVIQKVGGYSPHSPDCEDYDLWVRALDVTDIQNIPEVLLDYRVHNTSFTSKYYEKQSKRAAEISGSALKKTLGRDIPSDVIAALRNPYGIKDAAMCSTTFDYFIELRDTFCRDRQLSKDESIMIDEDVSVRVSHLYSRFFRMAPIQSAWNMLRIPLLGPSFLGLFARQMVQRYAFRNAPPVWIARN